MVGRALPASPPVCTPLSSCARIGTPTPGNGQCSVQHTTHAVKRAVAQCTTCQARLIISARNHRHRPFACGPPAPPPTSPSGAACCSRRRWQHLCAHAIRHGCSDLVRFDAPLLGGGHLAERVVEIE
mmetsp:Transcript_38443/g.101374  ORF Transcript_38443/g.101374 Transcript_38443/m.101374 type:complete len:127 (-) Transcript_38443:1516-1896(-)